MTAATAAPPKNLGHLDYLLDDSLEDFEHCLSLPVSRSNSRFFSIPLPTTSAKGETPHPQHPHHHQQATPFGYPSVHSGFRSDDTESDMSDQEVDGGEASHGGYSPPAWRRLANGDRSSGFWRKANSRLNAIDPLLLSGFGGLGGGLGNGGWSREFETSPEYDSMNEDDMDQDAILQKAIRTRLPTGSLSPEKERSPEPEYARRQQLQKQAERQQKHQRLAPVIEEDDVKIKEEPMEEDAGMVLRGLPRKGPDNCSFAFFVPFHHPSPFHSSQNERSIMT